MGEPGWIEQEIAQEYLDKLTIRAPGMPHSLFRYAVSRFVGGSTPATPKQVRDELEALSDAAGNLTALLSAMRWETFERLEEAELRHGHDRLSFTVRQGLRDLAGVAEMARRDAEQTVSSGRAESPNTQLVRDLAMGLRVGGGAVDTKPNGQLVQAFGIALSVAGKHAKDPAKTVASALKTIDGLRKE